jgi:hypothetical protein
VRIDFFRAETESLFEGLAKYQGTMESQLNKVREDEKHRIGNWLLSIGSGAEAEYDIAMQQYSHYHDFIFPLFLRYSFVVLLFLVVESQLNRTCDTITERRNLSMRAKDFRGSTMERCKAYLKKAANVPLNRELWEKIEDLAKVRDCIVHALGKVELSRDAQRLRDLARQNIGLSIGNDDDHPLAQGTLIVRSEYCVQAVDSVTSFFRDMLDSAGFGASISNME